MGKSTDSNGYQINKKRIFDVFYVKMMMVLLASVCAWHTHAEPQTVLLFGQSGAGKTTTLNALYNAARSKRTPTNRIDPPLHAIAPWHKRLSEHALDDIEVARYGGITCPPEASQRAGSSDTRDFVGYHFTTNFSGWPADTALEIIDMPGIDDTSSTIYDDNSTDLQIIRAIEHQLKHCAHRISAIFVVVDNTVARVDNRTHMVMSAIRQMLTPEVAERVFIIVNRVRKKARVSSHVEGMIEAYLSWDEGAVSISSENYIKIDPVYLARFDRYLNDDEVLDQEQRKYTEDNLRDLLGRVGQFAVPISFHGYPEYRDYQYQLAMHIGDMIRPHLKMEDSLLEHDKLAGKIEQVKQGIEGRQRQARERRDRGDFFMVLAPLATFGAAIASGGLALAAAGTCLGGKLINAAVDDDWSDLIKQKDELKEHCRVLEGEIDVCRDEKKHILTQAQAVLDSLLATPYNQFACIDRCKLVAGVLRCVRKHRPQWYQDESNVGHIDKAVMELCQDLQM